MASGRDIFITHRTHLAELKDGQLLKIDIDLPEGLSRLGSSLDCKIIAYCAVGDSYLIYELIDRQFILKHTFSRFVMGIPGCTFSMSCCSYVQNILILRRMIDGLNNFEVIDLETNNTILMCYGPCPYYCDGIITIPPFSAKYSSKYNNINLADKRITHDCPYFMKKYEQITEPYTVLEIGAAQGFTCITENKLYQTVTGELLFTGNIDNTNRYYGNYIISSSWMTIVEGAPVVEYTYTIDDNTIYVYAVKGRGHATKAAAQTGLLDN